MEKTPIGALESSKFGNFTRMGLTTT